MAKYHCGNPICKGVILSDDTAWPLRCEKCNQQCYPENLRPGGRSVEGSYIRTSDGAFALPTAILMVEGPGGALIPFRYHPSTIAQTAKTEAKIPQGTKRGAILGPPRAEGASGDLPADASQQHEPVSTSLSPYYCGNPACHRPIPENSTRWPLRCNTCEFECYPEDAWQPTAVLLIEGTDGHLVQFSDSDSKLGTSPKKARGRASYYCGHSPCRRPIEGDGDHWPLRCARCGHDCYPRNLLRQATILLVEGSDGHLIPFRTGARLPDRPNQSPKASNSEQPVNRSPRRTVVSITIAILFAMAILSIYFLSR